MAVFPHRFQPKEPEPVRRESVRQPTPEPVESDEEEVEAEEEEEGKWTTLEFSARKTSRETSNVLIFEQLLNRKAPF